MHTHTHTHTQTIPFCPCANRFTSATKCTFYKKWQPAPVFLPGESHGQTSLAGYHPWGGTKVRHNLATKQQHLHHLEPQDFMVETLSVMPFISICHFSSPSLKLAACPLQHHILQQVDSFHVHIKAFRTDSHLLSRKQRVTGIP